MCLDSVEAKSTLILSQAFACRKVSLLQVKGGLASGYHVTRPIYISTQASGCFVVQVANRAAVKTTDYDRRCTAPEGLQTEIDRLVAQHPNGRSFVRYRWHHHHEATCVYSFFFRPSGTEDVVRVYAEAETQVM